jgi:PhzF family phenazine biosynthesis protein
MTLPLYTVDAFTDQPFRGNPAAVCLLDGPKDDAWLQAVAAEMNLSETAFLTRVDSGYRLRWFTPKTEVALCGHATLASAHILWQAGHSPVQEPIQFHTKSGVLKASRVDQHIELDFPLVQQEAVPAPPRLTEALGARPCYVGRNRYDRLLVELESEQVVRGLKPNLALIAALPALGVIVTARSATLDFDFVSRFFAPAIGVSEDPVTGGAHCCLASYWRSRIHKDEFRAYQASPRGGVMHVRVDGDRVFLGGQAVTVSRRELLV